MRVIEYYKRQHKIITSLCKQLKACAIECEVEKDASIVLGIQETLNKILTAHLSSEDTNLSLLLEKEETTMLKDELAHTTQLYLDYKNRYSTRESIESDPITYIKDTDEFVQKLLERVKKEEELYIKFKKLHGVEK